MIVASWNRFIQLYLNSSSHYNNNTQEEHFLIDPTPNIADMWEKMLKLRQQGQLSLLSNIEIDSLLDALTVSEIDEEEEPFTSLITSLIREKMRRGI